MAIVIDNTTGEIDLDQTTPGTYVVTYTVQGVSSTQEVTVNAVDDATFSYSASSYEPTDPDPTPTITGLTGGTFSGTTGLVINSTTGEIDLSASTVATHTITYDTTSSGSSVCPNTSTQTVEIAVAGIANNYSMNFDGVNDYIDVSDKFNFIHNTKTFSISVWLKMDSYNTNTSSVILGNNYTSSQIGFQFWIDNRQNAAGRTEALKFNLWDGTNSSDLLEDNVVSDNNWHNYVVVGDGTTLKYYKDGTQLTDTDSLPASTSSTAFANLRLGANTISTPSAYLDGNLDEVGFWNTALTSTQVSEIYNAKGTNTTKDLTTVSGSNLIYWNRMGD